MSRWFDLDLPNPTENVLVFSVAGQSSYVQLLAAPKNLKLSQNASVSVTVRELTAVVRCSGGTSLYVTLTTLAQGRFKENAILCANEERHIPFIPFTSGQEEALQKSIRVEHIGSYI